MDKEQFAKEFISWCKHLIPLLLTMGLFLLMAVGLFSSKLFLGKEYFMYLVFLLIIFSVASILDKELKKGMIIGIIATVLLFCVYLKIWSTHALFQEMIALNPVGYSQAGSLFITPLAPLIFMPLIVAAIFGPLLVVWLVRRKQVDTN